VIKIRILIPALEDKGLESSVSPHFGHCPFFALFDTETNRLKMVENVLDHGNPMLTPVDQIMKYKPDIVYALGMGQRAIMLFGEKGIKLKTGNLTIVRAVLDNLDNLEDLEHGCMH
jgi:predicted Fe-Mo cluster-binding NifX family protein